MTNVNPFMTPVLDSPNDQPINPNVYDRPPIDDYSNPTRLAFAPEAIVPYQGNRRAANDKKPKCLPKGTVVAYAKRNPTAIHPLPDKASRTLESVLHLPFGRTEEADETDGTQPTQPEPSKSAPPDWRTTVNLDHNGDADLRKRVIEMLEAHQDM